MKIESKQLYNKHFLCNECGTPTPKSKLLIKQFDDKVFFFCHICARRLVTELKEVRRDGSKIKYAFCDDCHRVVISRTLFVKQYHGKKLLLCNRCAEHFAREIDKQLPGGKNND